MLGGDIDNFQSCINQGVYLLVADRKLRIQVIPGMHLTLCVGTLFSTCNGDIGQITRCAGCSASLV